MSTATLRQIETVATEPKTGTEELPDGVHDPCAVRWLARLAGFEGDHLPGVVIFGEDLGFSETTAFIRTSNGKGYYRTTLTACSCPSFKYRGGPCKHQKTLSERLERKARIDARNAERREERAKDPKPSTSSHGFNLPEEART